MCINDLFILGSKKSVHVINLNGMKLRHLKGICLFKLGQFVLNIILYELNVK